MIGIRVCTETRILSREILVIFGKISVIFRKWRFAQFREKKTEFLYCKILQILQHLS